MNKIILSGNICNDIEIRYTKSNTPVATFNLAVSRIGEGTDFLPIVVWNKQAENIDKYCQKGTKILVEGRIQTRTYENNNEKRYITEIMAERVEFITTKQKSNQEAKNDVYKDFGERIKQEQLTEEDMPF